MNLRLSYTLLFTLLTGSLFCQSRYTKDNPDRLAILYMYCKDVPAEKLISKEDLTKHYFGEDSPVRKYWRANFQDRYHYKGKVFMVEIPMKEEDFAYDQAKATPDGLTNADNAPLHLYKYMLNKVGPEHDWKIEGFDPDEFDKVIYLLGESSLFSTGVYRGSSSPVHDPTIKINGKEIKDKHMLSLKGIQKAPDDQFTLPVGGKEKEKGMSIFSYKKYPFGLWPFYDASVLHEWAHSFSLFHSNMPVGQDHDEKRFEKNKDEIIYTKACQDNFRFSCFNYKVDMANETFVQKTAARYGDPFCLMGRVAASIMLNPPMKDKTGMLPAEEKTIIASTKKNIKLLPYLETEKTGPRVAVIQIDKPVSTPLIDITGWETADPKPTAKIDLYASYRRAQGYDAYLGTENLVENTKGLMIHLSMREVEIERYQFKKYEPGFPSRGEGQIDNTEQLKKDYEEHSWLLDMSPQNGNTQVTLNPGWDFYHEEWEVSILNVRPQGDDGITFDVEYGKKEGIETGVYKTTLETCEAGLATMKYQTHLNKGERLQEGEKLVSANGKYQLRGASDGEFVIEEITDQSPCPYREVWRFPLPLPEPGADASQKSFLSLNDDCNVYVYSKQEKSYWATNGVDELAPTILSKCQKAMLTDDGRFILVNQDGKEVWSMR